MIAEAITDVSLFDCSVSSCFDIEPVRTCSQLCDSFEVLVLEVHTKIVFYVETVFDSIVET